VHVPDGFLSPQTYGPAYAVATGCWALGLRRLRRRLDEQTIPRLAVLTALAFALMAVAIPLPGGTSVHGSGIALLAVLFGVWPTFMALSLVLLMQAVLFGEGGVTALPVNALAMGLAGAATARAVHRLVRPASETAALFLAGWLSVVVASILVATVLGIQPLIARDAAGDPLFFPFGLGTVLPAVVVPHLLLGIGEGILTVLVVRIVRRLDRKEAA
jgi:cobalt/nickel transport system permease protein